MNIYRRIPSLIIAFSAMVLVQCSSTEPAQPIVESFHQFEKLKITQIKPSGWIEEFLNRQRTGLTGNIEVAGYPFNTCLWACEKMEGSTKAWWPYEQTAYYLDGVHRLGYLLDDDALKAKAQVNMDYVKEHLEQNGRFGTNLADKWWRWPYASFNRLFMVDYEVNGEEEVLELLKNHYLTFQPEDFQDDLELANVEQLCWVYDQSGDKRFLTMAEKAYKLFQANRDNRSRSEIQGVKGDIQFGTDRVPTMHGVVYLELAKIPALLFEYTGNERYLQEATNALAKMEKHFMMAGGLPSTTEHFKELTPRSGYEVCNTAVFPYTYGHLLRVTGDVSIGDKIEKAIFNAAIGSVSKDFKTHQYFSAPNQVLANMESNTYGHNPARNAFLPGHDVECCTGNVNRFMPYYVEQMWLGTEDGIAASLYGPSQVSFDVEGQEVIITETTNYPFSNEISFQVGTNKPVDFSLKLRIPEWAKGASVSVNDAPSSNVVSGEFFEIKRTFSSGDQIKLTLPMEVELVDRLAGGVSVERGPLVFSLPVADQRTKVEDYEKSTEAFPGWALNPSGKWNYALASSEFEVIETPIEKYPWSENAYPIRIRAQVRKVTNWQLSSEFDHHLQKETMKTPLFPEKLELAEETEMIELIPYGNTMLRITNFPKAVIKN